jgi:hypothetical protein
MLAALVAAALVPASASASTLSQRGPTVTVDIDTPGDAIDIRPARLQNAYRISADRDLVNDGTTCDAAAGDPAAWICGAEEINARVNGSAGADSVSARCRSAHSTLRFDGGAGHDTLTVSGCHASEIRLGDGNDDARVGSGSVDAGSGHDRLEGGDGVAALAGGAGRDLLAPGAGKEHLAGGTGNDTVSYEDRAAPVNASLDGVANDGAPGEQDLIAGDVEDLIGGTAGDVLLGDAGTNDIDGGDGGDVIDAGSGNDGIDAGAGNDRVSARDGAIDRVECGDGEDQAIIDAFDVASGCEDVQTSRSLMPDVDDDGIPTPADCNDGNPAIRPGLRDTPGNRIDEDCLAGDAPFARVHTDVQWTAKPSRRWTRFERLSLNGIPAAATVELRCRGRAQRCFAGVYRVHVKHGAARLNLLRPLRGRRLKRGARLELRVRAPESIAKVVTFDIRANRLPRTTRLCLAPGQLAPHPCR